MDVNWLMIPSILVSLSVTAEDQAEERVFLLTILYRTLQFFYLFTLIYSFLIGLVQTFLKQKHSFFPSKLL